VLRNACRAMKDALKVLFVWCVWGKEMGGVWERKVVLRGELARLLVTSKKTTKQLCGR
jgi:hypothetical protein